jgi:hypothetical protein
MVRALAAAVLAGLCACAAVTTRHGGVPNHLTDARGDLTPSLGARAWVQADGTFVSLPPRAPEGADVGGDQAAMLGARAGVPLLPIALRQTPWGWRAVDDLSVGAGAGMSWGAPADVPARPFAAFALAHNAVGFGYRGLRGAGIFAGLRPTAAWYRLVSGSHVVTSLPAFVRAEIGGGQIAAEAVGLTLAGESHWGGALHLTGHRPDSRIGDRFITLRADRTTFASSLRSAAGEVDADVQLSTYTLLWGFGF